MSTIGEQTNGRNERQRLMDNSNDNIEHGDPPLLLSTSSSDDDECHFKNSVDDTVSFMPEEKTMPIDNTTLLYIPVHLPCGILVFCSPEVLSRCPMVLRSLQTDLIQCLRILPWSVHAFVRRTVIWVNFSYSYGSCDDPRVLRHSTAHHEDGWLVHCANDRPDKARGVEIYSCYDFERMRLHWNGCGLLLHELCHLIHQFALKGGLYNEVVLNTFKTARESGLYEETLRRDWAGLEEDSDMAYAMLDHKEFFAEMSVTFLSDAYQTLDTANKLDMGACCPPLIEPNVTSRVLRKHGIDDPLGEVGKGWLCSSRCPTPKLRLVDPVFQETAINRSCLDVRHCNKFYPFTRGQLKHHDPVVYCAIRDLWNEISVWDDVDDRFCNRWIKCLWTFSR